MREIKFRGYNRKNNKWLYGYYLINRGQHFICPEGIVNPLASWEDFVVEEESVGQWTGIKDREGADIYEGDIVNRSVAACNYADGAVGVIEDVFEVMYNDFGFLPFLELDFVACGGKLSDYKIIGNVYQNKELLEDEG